MKVATQVLFASLAAGSVLPRGDGSHNGSAIADSDFVYVDGLRLYNGDGLYYLTGKDILLSFRSRGLTYSRHQLLGVHESCGRS